MKNCRFCQSNNLVKVVDLGMMPLVGAFLKQTDFITEKFYPLSLYFCRDCFLVQILDIPKQQNELYRHTFFRSSTSDTVKKHFDMLASEICAKWGQCSVLEVGSNDGVLINALKEYGIKAIGVDPIVNDYFSEEYAKKLRQKFDVIVASYSFAHIDDMIDIMKGIKLILKEKGVFIIETFYLKSLIEEMQYDMIYHEHMSYYSVIALVNFLAYFDMEIFDFKYDCAFRSGCMKLYVRNKGQGEESISLDVINAIKYEYDKGYNSENIFKEYFIRMQDTKKQLMDLLNRLKKGNKTIMGYGATGRGAVIMNYCKIDKHILACVIDDTTTKQGFFTPGTHILIKSWEFIDEYPDYILLFAWAFCDEIIKKRENYIKKGGRFIVPLPQVAIIPNNDNFS